MCGLTAVTAKLDSVSDRFRLRPLQISGWTGLESRQIVRNLRERERVHLQQVTMLCNRVAAVQDTAHDPTNFKLLYCQSCRYDFQFCDEFTMMVTLP